ncbi:hypothetical protein DFH08DRAFT_1090198, partial [Mycena albidolilacea]
PIPAHIRATPAANAGRVPLFGFASGLLFLAGCSYVYLAPRTSLDVSERWGPPHARSQRPIDEILSTPLRPHQGENVPQLYLLHINGTQPPLPSAGGVSGAFGEWSWEGEEGVVPRVGEECGGQTGSSPIIILFILPSPLDKPDARDSETTINKAIPTPTRRVGQTHPVPVISTAFVTTALQPSVYPSPTTQVSQSQHSIPSRSATTASTARAAARTKPQYWILNPPFSRYGRVRLFGVE